MYILYIHIYIYIYINTIGICKSAFSKELSFASFSIYYRTCRVQSICGKTSKKTQVVT